MPRFGPSRAAGQMLLSPKPGRPPEAHPPRSPPGKKERGNSYPRSPIAGLDTTEAVGLAGLPEIEFREMLSGDHSSGAFPLSSDRHSTKVPQLDVQVCEVERLFSRGLTPPALLEVRALLKTDGSSQLPDLVEREYSWAINAAIDSGASSSSSCASAAKVARPKHLGYAGALIALRQLSYLNGLPALDVETTFRVFDMHRATCQGEKNCASGTAERTLSMEMFEAVFMYLLRAALKSTLER